jgi:putative membrane-bound dehydrogenase-like protein
MKLLLCFLFVITAGFAEEPLIPAGVAKIDITPDYRIRLSGYGNRREESEGVAQRIWAKALVFGAEKPAVLITVDNCGITDAMRAELLKRLAAKAGITSERLAISFSHTHCGPCLKGALVNIFSSDIPPEHQSRIDRYSLELTDKLEQVVLTALADRKPAQISWAVGSAKFARNRRAAWGGPVDHAVPVMFIHAPAGELRAVFANYACHATTLSFNQIHGDWPGSAMIAIERDHPGAVALMGIGCGADQNPHPRGTVELTEQHGEEIAAEVKRLNQSERRLVRGPMAFAEKPISLPLDKLPAHEELEQTSKGTNLPAAYLAKKNLARLDRGEKLDTELPYRVQRWSFGNDLAMLFMPGEITIDYQTRLKTEFDSSRLWVNGYCNDALCYIPSERVLAEGGYEGATAMVYYDRPVKFAAGIEQRIISAVHEIMPKEYRARYRADVPPKSPAQSMAAMQVKAGLTIELMAAEPFVADPVAIDWDAHGRMWVVEQPDYPNGMDGNWKPGGRVKILTDTDGDGRFDRSDLVLEGIPFPTGITCWRGGALVCAAPDILFVEDTNGDNKADKVEKLFTGFYTDNYNARINSLTLGLDGWIHGANGLLGGKIRSVKTGVETDIAGRDIRINPDTGELQLVSGVTQQGRTRDDWDNWFGCSNSRWIYHFPLPERYIRRNPHVPGPAPSVYLPADANADELKPASQTLERFNNPTSQGHITSACGLGIYRDELLGPDFTGNAFIGETAHNLVRRYQLVPDGATFKAMRPQDERGHEFLASQDNWTRPVQIRTGPDGALYVVDMYRAVIEHTRWIPADRLAKIDPRAGDTMGRIYRILPTGKKARPVVDLTQFDTAQLVTALDTPNGTVRDLVHQLLLHRADSTAVEPLSKLAASSKHPAVRVQSLAVLDGMKALSQNALMHALHDADALVRRFAVRLSEKLPLNDEVLALAGDPEFIVRYQLALSLGEWDDPRAARRLVELAAKHSDDAWFRAAVISSSAKNARSVLEGVVAAPALSGRTTLLTALVTTAAATAEEPGELLDYLTAITSRKDPEAWQLIGLAQTLKRKGVTITDKARSIIEAARDVAANEKADVAQREAALRLLGADAADVQVLADILRSSDITMQKAALSALARTKSPEAAEAMLAGWARHPPSLRGQIIATLISRDAWAARLLEAVEQKLISPAEIPATSRQTLATHANTAIRERSARLLPAADTTARAKVVGQYQVVATLKGDAVKGAAVFKTICFTCHAYLSQGMAVGPDLKAFYNKPAGDFITAILNPNAAIEPRYAAYIVSTKDSRTLTGVIANETATSIDVLMPGGIKETLLRTDLKDLRATGISLMPDGLEQSMTPQAMADLIAYLKSGG